VRPSFPILPGYYWNITFIPPDLLHGLHKKIITNFPEIASLHSWSFTFRRIVSNSPSWENLQSRQPAPAECKISSFIVFFIVENSINLAQLHHVCRKIVVELERWPSLSLACFLRGPFSMPKVSTSALPSANWNQLRSEMKHFTSKITV
jgi:hypothetical protein